MLCWAEKRIMKFTITVFQNNPREATQLSSGMQGIQLVLRHKDQLM
jgi:hypothetical protein